jgi:hypothetical protein
MANFLEFLKSGKTAKEFIDTSILPQNVLPVEKTGTSPDPYENEELGFHNDGNDTDSVLDTAVDQYEESSGDEKDRGNLAFTENIEDDDDDAGFLARLEAAENEGFEEE